MLTAPAHGKHYTHTHTQYSLVCYECVAVIMQLSDWTKPQCDISGVPTSTGHDHKRTSVSQVVGPVVGLAVWGVGGPVVVCVSRLFSAAVCGGGAKLSCPASISPPSPPNTHTLTPPTHTHTQLASALPSCQDHQRDSLMS